jgi:ElaB/YqjD/DUF883 family membrane-anchored ribosome-binding protein
MKKKIINGLLFAVALVAATSSFVSCKDYEGDNYAEFQEKYATLLQAYNAQVKAMQDYVLKTTFDETVGEINGKIDEINKETGYSAAELANKGTIKKRLDDLEKDTASLAARIQKNNEAIASLGDDLDEFILLWGDNLADAYKNVGKAKQIALSYDADTAAVNRAIEHAQDIADKAWEYVNKGQAVDKNGETKEDFQAWVKYFEAADNDLADDIDDLNDEVDDILERLGALEEAYKAKIDGVIVQEVRNPIFGTYAYPFGFETNILAAYYGGTQTKVYFPAGDGKYAPLWVHPASPAVLTTELEAIDAPITEITANNEKDANGEYILMDETEGNAGQIAMTVNTNADLEGKKFNLATFTGNISKFELSGLKPATEDLYFGHRAAASNGAWVMQASISKANVKDVNFSLDMKGTGMKAAVKDLLKNFSSASTYDVIKLGLGFFQIIDNAKTLKLGLQTQYKDPVVGWTTSFYDADIAAMSIRPLGYEFLSEDGDFSAPIVKIKDKVTAKESAYEKEIENLLKVQFGLPEGWDGDIYVDANGRYWLDIDGNPANRKDITAIITTLSKPIVDKTKAAQTKVHNVLSKLIARQNKVFDKVIAFASNPNRYIQPALLAANQNLGYFYPSRIWMAPTQVKAGVPIQLYPTTLTAEVIAPAYKKYVAILAGPTAGKNYNTVSPDLNKVLDGTQYNINKPMQITLTEPGLYEFVFECLGYNGKVAGKKYYIEVY